MSTVELRDICDRVDYGLTTSAVLDGSGPKFLRITDIDGSFVDWDTVPHCELSTKDEAKYRLQTGDIVVARTGASTGRSQWVQVSEPAVFASYLVRFRVRDDVDSRYVGYVLSSTQWQDHVASVAHGKSAQPNMGAGEMARFTFDCPPLSEQQAIAEVLGALDDKIAANTKLIDLLHRHMVAECHTSLSKGVEPVPLGSAAVFHNRRRVPLSARERDAKLGNVPYYGASGIFGTVDEALFDERLVLVGEDGSVIKSDGTPVVQYIWGPAWVNNHAHVLSGSRISTELLYLLLSCSQVASLVTGAVQPKINMGNLKKLLLEIPRDVARLEAMVDKETAVKRVLVDENETLAVTRDALLPHLMSGKVRVKDAEAVVGNLV